MSELISRYHEKKKAALSARFSRMNPMQQQAVFAVNGPVLILAGAGSGKTTVLINRIQNLVCYGDSYHGSFVPQGLSEEDIALLERGTEHPAFTSARLEELLAHNKVRPWNILAITFTNKAAGELRARLEKSLGAAAKDVNAATFHSACVRILRRDIQRLGYDHSFTIYDSDDSIRVIKKQLDILGQGNKTIKPRTVLSMISKAKDRMLSPGEMLLEAKDFLWEISAKVYAGYQQELRRANAVDFDDIILLTVQLLEQCPEVLEYYQNRFRYIMVDEYQDTNMLQYRLISLLAGGQNNLCVVGDDDQSIYKFRGATIENILSFEIQFPGAMVIRLEQNYRSTGNILEAANSVIKNNATRKGKKLWTDQEAGPKIQAVRHPDEQSEARWIVEQIAETIQKGGRFSEHAVLYRMNAQSNAMERELGRNAVPYRIIGGLRFYERKEIKDAVSYLSVLHNPADNLRLTRILNEPKRGIGEATIAAATQLASENDISLYTLFSQADEYAALSRKQQALRDFAALLDSLRAMLEDGTPLDVLFDEVLERTGYLPALKAQGEVELTRIENLMELKTNIQHYMAASETPTLGGFLEEIALYTDLDTYNDSDDYVVMMTIHSAKGLEFNHVFVIGLEEGIFPGNQSIYNPEEVEEERRLAYVAYTRARVRLALTCAATRMLFGSTMRNPISRFIREIEPAFLEFEDRMLTSFTPYQRQSGTGESAQPRGGAVPAASAARTVPAGGVAASVAKKPAPNAGTPISPGDRVRHAVYGEGRVVSVKPMGGDRLVEIHFQKAGSKKVMANYAKLEILEQ